MNARRIMLAGVNMALAAALVLALAPAEDAPEAPVAKAQPAKASVAEAAGPSVAGDATARPLFARRQAPPPAPVVAKPPPAAPAFRLAGVLWGDAERLAVLQLPDDAGHRRVRLGESVDDWTLSELTPRTATFSAGERKATLGLVAENRPRSDD